ncbi:MAG: anaerobic ribonucleoside-triphosphate reductase activating protein [Spirochaetales bacterium]|jgi:pyruvate formate lyase activating enzyme|nr:anaerobic ribonucleoside-triphosphate reductase activating protein [Spirochaetales bacterium]
MSLTKLGLIKTSLIDYPGEVAAVIFTPGCNLRCPFCHNPELVTGETLEDMLSVDEILSFLERRKTVLGGVCITGGEPLIHEDLSELTSEITALDLKIKIDTNGTFPERLSQATPSFVALDVKTSPGKYDLLSVSDADLQYDLFDSEYSSESYWSKIEKTMAWISTNDIAYEIRTTVAPGIVTPDDIDKITTAIAAAMNPPGKHSNRGLYILAGFRPEITLHPSYSNVAPYPADILEEMQSIAIEKGLKCSIRWNREGS